MSRRRASSLSGLSRPGDSNTDDRMPTPPFHLQPPYPPAPCPSFPSSSSSRLPSPAPGARRRSTSTFAPHFLPLSSSQPRFSITPTGASTPVNQRPPRNGGFNYFELTAQLSALQMPNNARVHPDSYRPPSRALPSRVSPSPSVPSGRALLSQQQQQSDVQDAKRLLQSWDANLARRTWLPTGNDDMPQRLILILDGTLADGGNPIMQIAGRSRTNCYDLYRMLQNAHSPDSSFMQRVIYIPGPATPFWNWDVKEISREALLGERLIKVVRAVFKVILRQRRTILDELVLIGWSRGAFALQLLSQFIGDFGFERFYDSQGYPDMKKVDAVFDMLEGARVRRVCLPPVLGRDNMVLALGLFDTVGAVIGTDQLSHIEGRDAILWGFVPGYVGRNVKRVFQALAVDETLDVFKPTRMVPDPHKDPSYPTNARAEIKEVWFSGCHDDVGGPVEKSKRSLEWMLRKLGGIIGVDDYWRNYYLNLERSNDYAITRFVKEVAAYLFPSHVRPSFSPLSAASTPPHWVKIHSSVFQRRQFFDPTRRQWAIKLELRERHYREVKRLISEIYRDMNTIEEPQYILDAEPA